MPNKSEPICLKYDPWKRRSTVLNMAECFHFIPTSERCDCNEAQHYNETCPWQGYPVVNHD